MNFNLMESVVICGVFLLCLLVWTECDNNGEGLDPRRQFLDVNITTTTTRPYSWSTLAEPY